MRVIVPALLASAALLLASVPAASLAQEVVQPLPGTTDADRRKGLIADFHDAHCDPNIDPVAALSAKITLGGQSHDGPRTRGCLGRHVLDRLLSQR